jgi:hypothetical protein
MRNHRFLHNVPLYLVRSLIIQQLNNAIAHYPYQKRDRWYLFPKCDRSSEFNSEYCDRTLDMYIKNAIALHNPTNNAIALYNL